MKMRYETGSGKKLFDGTEPKVKTYESLEKWTDTGAFIVEKEDEETYKELNDAYSALSRIIEYWKDVYTEDGVYWWTIDYTDGLEYSDPVDTIVYIKENEIWKRIE